MTELQKKFEATGYASWINSDTYPNGKIYTNEYVQWLEKQLDASQSKWVSCAERLPDHENNVLAVLDGEVCIMNYFTFEENDDSYKVWGYVYDGIDGDGIFDDNYYPTKWQEIPPVEK